MLAGQVVALPGPVGNQYADESPPQNLFTSVVDGQPQTKRVPTHPKDRRISRPQRPAQHDEEEARVELECFEEVQVHQLAGATRAAAPEARQAGVLVENAGGERPARLEPRPGKQRPAEEHQRPDELMVKFAWEGGPTDDADSHVQ